MYTVEYTKGTPMIEEYTHIQPMADKFKHLILYSGVSKSKQVQTIRLINKIERAGWAPRAMQQAIDEIAPGRFGWDAARLMFTAADVNDEDAATYVQRVIRRYAELIEYPLFGEVMGIEDAALYLGVSTIYLKKSAADGTLKGEKPGHDLIFTRAQLDQFNENRRPVGRPKPVKE